MKDLADHFIELFDYGKIHWRKNNWVFTEGNKKPVLRYCGGEGEPMTSRDGELSLVKEASTICTVKDFTGQFPHTDKSESHFYVPKKVCQACEHHNNGYCTPMIEQDKKRLDESFERIKAKNQELTKKMFS